MVGRMTGGASDIFDRIHAEFDAIPPETWTEREAALVLAALTRIRRARNPLSNIGCVATPRLHRQQFGVAG